MYTDHEEQLLTSLTVKVLDQERSRKIDSRSIIDLSVITVVQWFHTGTVGGDAETLTGGNGGSVQGGGAGVRGTVSLSTVTPYFNVTLFRRFDAIRYP